MAGWQTFYEIVGTAAAALIGMQFVVITLIVSMRMRTSADSIAAFGTPTVVHLSGALLISAIMCAPWPAPVGVAIALASCGLAGATYVVIATRRAHRQTIYEPVWEDWIFHTMVPGAAYVALVLSAAAFGSDARVAPFVIGAVALALLFDGIHNSWDTVTHILVLSARHDERKKD